MLGLNLNIFKKYPTSINIAITNRCNLACSICNREYFSKSFPYLYDLPLETLKRVEWFNKISVLDLCSGINEPLLYPQFSELLHHLSNYNCAIRITTNLLPANEQKIKAIAESNVKSIQLSINAGRKDTYERIMKNANWERLNKNLDYLMNTVTRSGRSDIDIFVNYVVCKSNFLEIGDFLKFAKGFGITEIYFDHFKYVPHASMDASESMYMHKEEWNETMPYFYEMAQEYGIKIRSELALFDLDNSANSYEAIFKDRSDKCLMPYNNLVMQMAWNNPNKYWLHFCGSQVVAVEIPFDNLISSKDLLNAWNHPLLKKIRKTCNKRRCNPLCLACKHTDKRKSFVDGKYFDIFFSKEIINYCTDIPQRIDKNGSKVIIMPFR